MELDIILTQHFQVLAAALAFALWAVWRKLGKVTQEVKEARQRAATQEAIREFEHDAQSTGDAELVRRLIRGGL